MIESPIVSIVVPTYNRAKLLMRSVESVLQQTYPNFELIIIDDGSADQTMDIVTKLSDQRIKYIRNRENIGAAGARNVGISLSKYDYIAFQDSDDIWMADKLEKQMAILTNTSEDISFIYCSYFYHGLDSNMDGIAPRLDIDCRLKRGKIMKQLLLGNLVGTPTMVVKKKCLDMVGTFNESYSCLEDYELVLRLAKSHKVEFLDEVLVHAYECKDRVTNNMEGYFQMSIQLIGMYKSEILSYGIFDEIVGKLFQNAAKSGKLDEVKEKLMSIIV